MISVRSLILGALLRPIMLYIHMAEAVFCFGKPALAMGEFKKPFFQLAPKRAVPIDKIISGFHIRCGLELIEKAGRSMTPLRIWTFAVK